MGSKPQPQIEQLRTVQTFADEIAEGKASALKLEGVDQPYGDKTKPGYWESIHPSDRGWAEFGDKLTQQAKHSGSVISESVFGNLNALDKRGQRGKVMEALGMEVKSSTTFGSNQYTLYQTPESGVWQPVVVQSKPQSTNSGMTYFLPNISKAEELIQAAVSSQKKDREFELHLSLLDQSELAVYPGAVTVEGATIIGQTPEGLLPSLQGERNGGSFRVHAAALLDKGLRDTWEIAGTQAQISKN